MSFHIGGYFGLEISTPNRISSRSHTHLLTNGRSALLAILEKNKPDLLWIPFFCCDSILSACHVAKVEYRFYSLDGGLEPLLPLKLNKNQMVLYIDYFGLKYATVKRLEKRYNTRLIVDNTQAPFSPFRSEVISSFNSLRKYVGLPDGAEVYGPKLIDKDCQRIKTPDLDHLVLRLEGDVSGGYLKFLQNETALMPAIFRASFFSEALYAQINWTEIKKIRLRNLTFLISKFNRFNNIPVSSRNNGLFCYPLLLNKQIDRSNLSKLGLYIPTYWPEVCGRDGDGFEFERDFVSRLLPLPIDQRCSLRDLKIMTDIILNSL
jgi:hypothetical protein